MRSIWLGLVLGWLSGTGAALASGPTLPLRLFQTPPSPDGELFLTYCGAPHEFWFTAEFLYMKIDGSRLPPIATVAGDADSGALGDPATRVVIGNERLPDDWFPGGRVSGGVWLDYNQRIGLTGSFDFLSERDSEWAVGSDGAAGRGVVARPFFNPLTNSEDAFIVAAPGSPGTVFAQLATSFRGAEGGLRYNYSCFPWGRIDLLAGFTYRELTDDLLVREVTDINQSTFVATDAIDARNRFYGGHVGIESEFQIDGWIIQIRGKVALGVTDQAVGITGLTDFPVGGFIFTEAGGVLAVASNQGRRDRDRWGVIPELSITIGYPMCEYVHVFAGYSVIYWNETVRAGDQIDRQINPLQVPIVVLPPIAADPALPAFEYRTSGFWAHGLRAGMEIRY